MPLYVFICRDCQIKEEQLINRSDPDENLPFCKCGKQMERQFPLSNFKVSYSNIENFGTPQYAEHRMRECGVEV